MTKGSLSIGGRNYKLNHNVYLAAFGKAALGMVQGAEAVIGEHLVKGVASVPRKTLQKLYAFCMRHSLQLQLIQNFKKYY